MAVCGGSKVSRDLKEGLLFWNLQTKTRADIKCRYPAGEQRMPAALRRIKLSCQHCLPGAFFHLRWRHIFNVSCNTPEMPEWILDKSRPITIELVLNRL